MPPLTPADLALELGQSQKRVRAVLRNRYSALPEGTSRWELNDQQVAVVREVLSRQLPSDADWSLEVGDTVARRQIHAAYGGQMQGGISTPRGRPDIFIFTDPVSGARFGYDQHEGPQANGSYFYTGAGATGPQEFARGNLALRDAAANGKTIRLFTTRRTMVTYIGGFTTGDPSYSLRQTRDSSGGEREAIIFNLVPLDADQSLLVTDSVSEVLVAEWKRPSYTDISMTMPIQLEVEERAISRVEHELQGDFGDWLTATGHPPQTMRLGTGIRQIIPDLYVPSRGWIVEAKKSSGRGYVRTAIGQVLDYVHMAKRGGTAATPVILLPGRPEPDLVDLIGELGIVLAIRDGEGFVLLG